MIFKTRRELTTSQEWQDDCLHWRGQVLRGRASHWCWEWDGLPIDETCSEWPCGCWWYRMVWFSSWTAFHVWIDGFFPWIHMRWRG